MRRIAANYVFPIIGEPIKNGYIDISDTGEILAMGELEKETESTEFYNGILCPGFVNSHCHIELSHLKDKFKRGTGMSGFIDQINQLRDSSTVEEKIECIEREMENLYQQGVSAMADISNGKDSFDAKSKSPIYTRTFLEVFGCMPEDADSVIEDVLKLNEVATSFGLDAAPTPHSPYTMSLELLKASTKEGLKRGYLSYHNQESPEEEELMLSGTGALAQNYKSRGLPTPAVTGETALLYFLKAVKSCHYPPFEEKILLVHNTVTNEKSIDAAKEVLKNSYWVTCPLSNIFIHSTIPPLRLLRRKGVKICLGTDSLSSNHILSMVEEIKCIQQNFRDIELNEILKWACYNGAEALGKEDVYGSLEVGKKPGVVLIDKINWTDFKLTNESSSRRIV